MLAVDKTITIHKVGYRSAYVSGETPGLILESPYRLGDALNGVDGLDINVEKKIIEEKLKELSADETSTDKSITLAMKDLGIERANKFGWPNTYVFTKALGEMVLGHLKGDMPLVILRPTIILSTYKEPFPGWIEGIRTIDSLAVGYGKGRLACFLGDPESTIDVIPADMVANAMIATMAAHANQPGETIYHVGSSVSNPLKYKGIQKSGYNYFSKNPWINKDGTPVIVSEVKVLSSMDSFRRYFNLRYLLPLQGLQVVNSALCHAFSGTYSDLKRKINFVLRVVELYKPYLFSKSFISIVSADFNNEFDITWGDGRGKILNGELLTLSLDKSSGSGFESRNEYLFGKIDMQLKLVPGNSAGTVTAYYLSSKGSNWDEIDFEFLGNLSGDPYILHTNVFSQGKGNREQQFYLWFDPTADFHTYSILWNPQRIIFSVDGTPIREFKNSESIGVPFPKNQPMRIHSSLWNADDWATRGGLVKTDWSQAPFTASYRNFRADACVVSSGKSSCGSSASSGGNQAWLSEELDNTKQERLQWVQKNYMIYNYCSDSKRFPQGFPPECKVA
ncbi:unnamed protein product [Lactuca virosa]|uniref:xyloglucan:xyloglucosyl transferase n=1 Tax=Lactuca virosa TaxID=75947 RepID=A0AAU9N6K7_9ASTR|nr:unnamed protein product [Lactuca virosa]